MRALNVRPHTASVTPSTEPPTMSTTLSATRSNCSSLTAITPSSRSKSYPASSAMRTQRPRVLREAGTAPPRAGPEELVADALVVAHAEHDVVHVGADRLAHGGDGVDEADLRGEEGVGGVLDRLGRRRVGDDRAARRCRGRARPPGWRRPGRRRRSRRGRGAGSRARPSPRGGTRGWTRRTRRCGRAPARRRGSSRPARSTC